MPGPTDERLVTNRNDAHPDCFVCDPERAGGLNLDFVCLPEGGVEAHFACDPTWVGYPGYVHGGIVSCLLDGAMTNCLFGADRVGLTAEMTVRFLAPLLLGEPAVVRARLERDRPRLQVLSAEVVQGGLTKATAQGKFLPHPDFRQ